MDKEGQEMRDCLIISEPFSLRLLGKFTCFLAQVTAMVKYFSSFSQDQLPLFLFVFRYAAFISFVPTVHAVLIPFY
jgi:hypothetical protein